MKISTDKFLKTMGMICHDARDCNQCQYDVDLKNDKYEYCGCALQGLHHKEVRDFCKKVTLNEMEKAAGK